jgi:hypothetical protein
MVQSIMFYRQCILVIDDDGLSIGRMCQAGSRSLLGRRCRASSTRSEYAAMDLIEISSMNVRSEPEVRPVLDPGEPACSLMSKVTCETQKNPKQAPQRRLHFRVSVTGRWRSQESRLSNTGVPKSRNVKPQNRETGASLEVSATRVSDTGR